MRHLTLIAALFFGITSLRANNDTTEVIQWENECVQTIHWGIMLSTKDYRTAVSFAKRAAEQMDFEYADRGYVYSETEMLADTVACGCGEIHGYIPRGRYDNGEYLSIEIKGDYYVVVVTSGLKDEEGFVTSMDKARLISPDAYVLPQEVWMCCMH